MAEYNLGTAEGKLKLDTSDFNRGLATADAQLATFEGSAQKRGQALQAVSLGLVAIGTAGVAGVGLAINAAANFEERMSAVGAVSNASATDMDRLRKKALQLGKDTAFSATEAAFSLEELVKAGLSVEDVLNGAADATVALAAAGEVDLTTAATIASNAMNAFGLTAEQMPRVADLIAGAANASAIDVNEFGQSLQQSGAVAALVGLSFDDLSLAIAAMGNAGIRGSDAGTSLKTFLSNLQPVTDKQKQLFYDLGLAMEENATQANEMGNAFFDAEGNIKSMAEIGAILNDSLAGMSDAQKTMALETLFGSDAIRAAAIIADNGAGGFQELEASMDGITAAEVAEKRMDNLKGSLEQLTGSLDTLMITAGTPFLGMIRSIVDGLTEWINKISELPPEVLELAVQAIAIGSALALFAGGAGLAVKFLGPAAAAVNLFTGAVGRLTIALLTNPVVLLIVAIAALVAGIIYAYKNFEGFREVVDEVWRRIQVFAQDARDWFVNVLIPAIKKFADFFMKEVVPRVQAFVKEFVKVIERIVEFFIDDLIPAVVDVAKDIQRIFMSAWQWIENNVVPVIQATIELIMAILERLSSFWSNVLLPAIQTAIAIIVPVIQTAFAIIQNIIQAAMTAIQLVVEVVLNAIQTFWRLFGDNIVAAIQLAFDYVKSIVEAALEIIRGIIQVFTAIISGDWEKLAEGLKNIWDGLWKAVHAIIEFIVGAIILVVQNFFDAIHLAFSVGADALRLLWDLLWNAISLIVETIVEVVKGAIRTFFSAIDNIFQTGIGILKELWQGLWNFFEAIVGGPIEIVKGLIDSGLNAIKGFFDTFVMVVKAAWDGLWNGLRYAFAFIWGGIERFIEGVLETLKGIWQGALDVLSAAWDTLWTTITGIVSGAWFIIKTIIDQIIGIIQGAIDKIGDLIDKATAIPKAVGGFVGGALDAVGLSRGAIITQKEQLAVLHGPEAVIPLNDDRRALQLLASSGLADLLLASAPMATGGPSGVSGTASASAGTAPSGPVWHADEVHFHEAMQYDAVLRATEMAIAERTF